MQFRLTQLTQWVLALFVAVFLVQQTADQYFGMHLGAWLSFDLGGHWGVLSHVLLHRDPVGLLFNLIFIAFLVPEFETLWGWRRLSVFVTACILGSVILMVCAGQFGFAEPLVGPAAILFGLFGMYGFLFPERIMLLMMVVPVPAKYCVLCFFCLELLIALYTPGSHSASLCQLFGALLGAIVFIVGTRKRKKAPHLKLVKTRVWH